MSVTTTNDRIDSITCCSSGLQLKTLFIACSVYPDDDRFKDYNPRNLPHIHEGKNRVGRDAWLMKCSSVDPDQLKFICDDYADHSMLIQNEYVASVHEFAENNLLVYAKPDFLVVKDWEVVHTIAEPSSGNFQKWWQSCLPGFHPESFPFVVSSGVETFNLVNTQEAKMEVLVQQAPVKGGY